MSQRRLVSAGLSMLFGGVHVVVVNVVVMVVTLVVVLAVVAAVVAVVVVTVVVVRLTAVPVCVW